MVIRESLIKDILRPIIWLGLRRVVFLIRPGREFALYRAMGRAYYSLARGKRRQLLANLALFLGGGRDLRYIARGCMENHFVDRYLNFSFPKITRETLHRYAVVEGLQHLDAALARGRGCVLVHAHFGPSQLPLFALGTIGYPMNQISAPDVWGLSTLGRYCLKIFRRDEKMIPARIIQADGFLRPAFECLARNEVLMTAGDGTGARRFIGRGRVFSFMGTRLLFPLGAASLASRTQAAYVPLFTLPGEGKAPYRVVICEEIRAGAVGGREEAAIRLTENFLAVFSRMLRLHPSLWHFWDELDARLVEGGGGAAIAPRPSSA